jgi:exodeoxyribonuclease V alpha subunit
MERMLDLLEPGSMLVMIGDANQLPSVSSGQVFKDLLNSNKIPYTELKENFRQKSDSSIVGIANQIIQKSFRMPKDFKGEFKFWVEKDEVKIRNKILKLYLDHLPKERKIDGDKDIQILSPMRKGILGIHALNASIQNRKWEGLNPILEKNEQEKLFLNDKIINTKNNYDLEIMNGDIGEIIRNDKETIVKINNQEVSFNKKDIYSLEPAYAISIHKSQGSEYPIVIIPISKEHTHMLSTNLLYTAITRAKDEVIIIGDPEVFINGINSYWKTERDTFLPEALKKLL